MSDEKIGEYTFSNWYPNPDITESDGKVTTDSDKVRLGLIIGDQIVAYADFGTLNPDQEVLNTLLSGKPHISYSIENYGTESVGTINMWLSPNYMVSLSINLSEMAEQLRETRISELAATLGAMAMVWEFSQNASDMIMAAGVAESQMKMMEGASGVMQAAGGLMIVGLGAAASLGVNAKLTTFMVSAGGGTALSALVNGTAQAISGFVSAGLVLIKSGAESEKEIQETLKQLFNQILQSSTESRRELEDLLTKALEMLKSLWEQNARTYQNFLPHA